jgi:hypothetical protein
MYVWYNHFYHIENMVKRRLYMNMKKKLLLVFMALLTALSLTACLEEDAKTDSTTTTVTSSVDTPVPEHQHAFAEDWIYNAESHWQACECGEKNQKAEHTFENDVCTVCQSLKSSVGLKMLKKKYETSDGKYYGYAVQKMDKCTDTQIVIPAEYNGLPVVEIREKAFAGCDQITSVVIPGSIERIGSSAFNGCSSLENVKIAEGVTEIGFAAFSECDSLTEIILPNSVSVIGTSSFAGCWELTKIDFPDKLEHIGETAFNQCIALTEINLPDSVNYIGVGAFADCFSLVNVKLPPKITEISDRMFSGCRSLVKIQIPDSVTIIRESAFDGCYMMESVTIPKSVTSIGTCAFSLGNVPLTISYNGTIAQWNELERAEDWYTGLQEYYLIYCADGEVLGADHPHFAKGAWKHNATSHWKECPCGEKVEEAGHTYEGSKCTVCGFKKDSTGLEYVKIGKGYFVSYIGECKDTEISIPATYNGLPVIGIADNAFAGNEQITAVVLPDSVTTIQMFAFAFCPNLKSINLENVETIGSCAFYQCTALERVESACSLIEDSAFQNCKSLTTVKLTGDLEIYASAFAGCSKLVEITLPSSIEYFDILTFSNCTSLTDIHFLGTKAQWDAIERDDMEGDEMELNWNHNTGNYTVHCTDGDVAK